MLERGRLCFVSVGWSVTPFPPSVVLPESPVTIDAGLSLKTHRTRLDGGGINSSAVPGRSKKCVVAVGVLPHRRREEAQGTKRPVGGICISLLVLTFANRLGGREVTGGGWHPGAEED